MRKKRYFWDLKHHRQLDKKMGLSRQMAEPLASLAKACGMDTEVGGTRGINPFPIFSKRHPDPNKTIIADVNCKEYKQSFLMAGIFTSLN